ncbi:hypothetical protein V5799_008055 [Amblyomma americanum]|uniref:Na+/dicarboxylate na+/tricarboxylate and phosphate transporter n=1 Tax=Amblyomma americanum TaxID=6943 RepID=A0AAQ4FFV7_AMBAM
MEASHASSTSRSMLMSDALRKYKIIVGYLVFIAMLVGVFLGKDRLLQCGLAVGGIVVLWTLEPIPYHVASFVPLVVFPLSNLIPAKEVAMRYMNDDIIRALSGLFISILLQTSKLNRRMALYLLLAVGTSVRWLLLVYMWLVFLFAMFVTDAAVTAIMISLVDTLVAEVYASKVRMRVIKLNKANEEARLKQQAAAAAAAGGAGVDQEARAGLEGQDIAPYGKRPLSSPKASVQVGSLVSESTVGFFVVILAFLLPSDFHNFELKNRILKWNDVYHKMPWGVIFVMSGNIAISYALGECGVFKALMDWSRQLSANTVWVELFFLFLTSTASEVTTVKDRLPEFYYIAGNVILPGMLMKIVSCFLYLGILNSVGSIMMGDEVLAVVNSTVSSTLASTASSAASARNLPFVFDNKL